MSIMNISYTAKSRGDLWTATEANEVKEVVNNNASELSAVAVQAAVNANNISSLNARVTNLGNQVEVPIHTFTQTASEYTLQPHILYKWASAVNSLSIQLASSDTNIMTEYMMEIVIGSTGAFSLTFLNGNVRWANGEEPEWEPGYIYQVDIVGGLAIAAGWEAATE